MQFKEQIEQERQLQFQQKELLKIINGDNRDKKEIDKTSKLASTNSLFKIDEEKRTLSRKPSINLGTKSDKGNRNNTITNNRQNNNNIKI